MKMAKGRGVSRPLMALMFIMVLLLSACGGGGGGDGVPAIQLSASTLTFAAKEGGANPPTQAFTLKNTGAIGSTLSWSISDDADWLSVSPASGSLAQGASETITLTVDVTGLSSGSQTAKIDVTAAGLTTKSLTVELTVSQDIPPTPLPAIGLSTSTLTFTANEGGNPLAQTFTLTNTGATGTTLNWSISDDAAWLTVTPASGSLTQGASETITIAVDATGLLKGTQTANISVEATGLTAKTLTAQLTIGQALTLNPGSLDLTVTAGSNPADQTVTLANASDLVVPWTASSDAGWLTMNTTSGTLAANGQATLPVIKINALSLVAGTYEGTISITSTAAVSPVSLSVKLTVNAAAAAAAAKNVFIGGTAGIGQLSSLVATSASVAKAATQPTVLTDAKVTITVLRADGSTTTSLTKTNAQGAYSAQVDAVAGDTITVDIKKQGYTTLHKTVKVKADTKSQYTVSGNVAQAAVQVVQAADGVFKASGGTGSGFRFGLSRRASGSLVPFAGAAGLQAAAAAGSEPELDINIPASWAPDATAITTQLAAFDPSKADERQMFPGEFVGVGGGMVGAGKADTSEYALESVSFFQSEVMPNNGQPLSPTLATGAAKAASEATVIYKFIPQEGCEAVKKYDDRDGDATNGVQMPIYSYNSGSGKWVYIGEGTLKTYNSQTGAYDTVAVADVSANQQLSGLSCDATSYYFEIVTNEWYTWWNLDYPLLFAQPETVCISGTVVDSSGVPISGAQVVADGYIPNGANSYTYAYAATDGTFSFDLTLGDGKTPANYAYTAFDYSTWPANTSDFTSLVPTSGYSTTTCNDVGVITIVDSNTCSVSGTIQQETATGLGLAPEWTWVSLYTDDYSFNNWVYTDNNGVFESKSPCDKPVNLSTWANKLVYRVDGVQGTAEATDDSSKVVLEDLIIVNNAPDAYTWISPSPAKVNQKVELWASAWDYEGDYPLTYTWTIKDNAGASVATSNFDVFYWTPANAGTYSAEITVTDSAGQSTTLTETLVVNANENTPPVIYGAWIEASQTCGGLPNVYVSAYDSDGDTLSVDFTYGGTTYPGTLDGWIPSIDPAGSQITITVTDDGAPVKSTTAVIDAPVATGLELYYAEAWPQNQTVGTPVELYAYADSSDLSAVTYSWTITGPDTSAVFTAYDSTDNSYGSFVAQQPGEYTITLEVSGGACAETVTRSFGVTISPLSVAATGQYIQYRTYEDSTLDHYHAWIDYKDSGQLMDDWDFWGASLVDSLGNSLSSTPSFWKADYLQGNWNGTDFGTVAAGGYSGFSFNLSGLTIPAGDYTFVTQLNGGAEIQTPISYPGQQFAPLVLSSSMKYSWNDDGSLTLNWTEPGGKFDSYRIQLLETSSAYQGNSGEVFIAKADPGTSSVTLSAALLQQIYTAQGISSQVPLTWVMQTRIYDTNNNNSARAISNGVTIDPPPAQVEVIIQ